ncbi:MAG: Prepilin peptidase [Candidatus Gottesmanbacteria bacterium GW2011_GWB1_43_11]|uniref:Prepilin leader peptidase/N-methyltransferase n=1 Tax=Candidatus Gottesmanbacteria bacterium GW2011_GWB1_43_11 TaxID=1618446 RepID=A0A0G1CMJ7_9BACT|nr:MAG: Prepilin peptidase [Candidatus Gottesmanbacteria bacterium GW2011_GWA2_42_16]KKS86712.1 MAG: Prepilin peptidase [Candidatus Gottesmanbacteria bacterium GW2011_GWB1_43_11]OGG07517.1 MAG: hypothetical protein A2699_05560 [Candidatus Gottesmanbacteria bacterium RIFCSPHIGHO2_01_FULL_43_15]OGG25030.1 MAG: hypothetical protein A3A59_05505 [Candidatus Gottesmanbacteria bacterium RIFCSPLOWO2_01_FULL_42_10]
MEVFTLLALFTFGIVVGSFLNVLIDRLPQGESPWRGRSHCDHCQKNLAMLDLIPVLSFIFLGGKCRYCHKALSIQYPVIELVTGLLFVFTFLYTSQISTSNFELRTLVLFIIFCSFLVIFMADLKYQIIPDEMVIMLVLGSLIHNFSTNSNISIYQYIATGIGAGLFFLVIFIATKGRGMGFGDVKLALVLGLFLGFPQIIIALYLAFLTGAGVSLILIILKKKKLKARIAFGPFMLSGAVISFFYGGRILQWYLNFLR